ncbi:nuclear transport factor 2 family protein [Chitinophaga sp. RAB17]|uniref:nuclear transport factor 2 family protein n=1 Tax=Chitinophaga sp. RAB17 TaxID=3233049 RepID=UPI003F93D1DB
MAKYMEAFSRTDHEAILSCLTDNVIWELPGYYHLTGKAAFDGAIENDAFVGSPNITVIRMVEEGNLVVAEGTVQSKRKDSGTLRIVFCDMFHMEGGKIRQLTSYIMDVSSVTAAPPVEP